MKIPIENLNCQSCVGRVNALLENLDGVQNPHVNLATHSASFTLEGISLNEVSEALKKAGYPTPTANLRLKIANMNCASCKARIEGHLEKLPAVLNIQSDVLHKTVFITYAPSLASEQSLRGILTRAGYENEILEKSTSRPPEFLNSTRRFFLTAVCALPVILGEMTRHFFMEFTASPNYIVLIAVLTSFTLLLNAKTIIIPGLKRLWHFSPDMNSLIAIGVLAGYSYSLFLLFQNGLSNPMGTGYFESAAAILLFISFGRVLEDYAKNRAKASIDKLINHAPKTVQIYRDEAFQELPIEEIMVDDKLRILAGEIVPADGEIIENASAFDESLLTGEARPVQKNTGDEIVSGSINLSQSVIMRAQNIGEQTRMAQIVKLVENAQAVKLPIQNLIDQISRYFVPVILLFSLVTFSYWFFGGFGVGFSLTMMMNVLIIACPCAMGLAIPISVMVSTGQAAKKGIIYTRPSALLEIASLKSLSFDKTGTLTQGTPKLTEIRNIHGDKNKNLAIAAAMEAHSLHPLALAFREYFQPHTNFYSVISHNGKGLETQKNGRIFRLGSYAWQKSCTEEFGGAIPENLTDCEGIFLTVQILQDTKAKSPIIWLSQFLVEDALRDDAKSTVQALKKLSLSTAIISGDHQNNVEKIADELEISARYWELSPEEKLEAFAKTPAPRGYIGDGINDAPSLAAADVGFAMGSRSDMAMQAGDVVILNHKFSALEQSIRLSKATKRNISQNLFWAFIYNILLIPIAAGVLYPSFGIMLNPMIASAAMALSSVFVVFNALRLRKY